MKRFIALLFTISLFAAPAAFAGAPSCTVTSVLSTSTKLIAANDISPSGRHGLCVWNGGVTNPMTFTIGGTPVAGRGITLMPTAVNNGSENYACIVAPQGGALIAGGEVDGISASGTYAMACSW